MRTYQEIIKENLSMQNSAAPSDRYCELCKEIVQGEVFDIPKSVTRYVDIRVCQKHKKAVCMKYCEEQAMYLPVKYRNLQDTYNKAPMAKELMGSCVFCTGDPGSGKTFFTCMMLHINWREGKQGRFISYPEFTLELQSKYDSAYDKAKEIAHFPGLLVIDDLGAEKSTDFVRQMTYYIINHREQNELQTAINSNFSLAQIAEQIDGRIASRIAGMCEGGKNILKFSDDKRINKSGNNNS